MQENKVFQKFLQSTYDKEKNYKSILSKTKGGINMKKKILNIAAIVIIIIGLGILTPKIYAKIAFNAFAALNTHEHILSDGFDVIRNAICTGDGILDIAHFCKEETEIKPIFDRFNNKVKLGEHFHSVIFVTKEHIIYAFVALYGTVSPVQIKIGPCDKHYTDVFICD